MALGPKLWCTSLVSRSDFNESLQGLLTFAAPVRKLGAWIIENVFGDSFFASLFRVAKRKTVGEYHDLIAERDTFIKEFNQKVCFRSCRTSQDNIVMFVFTTVRSGRSMPLTGSSRLYRLCHNYPMGTSILLLFFPRRRS